MFGIGSNELILIILLMVIFIKPKDIPSVVKFIAKIFKKIRNFISHVKGQIDEITNEISDTKDEINETFHDKIEKLRLEIEKEPEFFDITPKLKIEKKHKTKKEK